MSITINIELLKRLAISKNGKLISNSYTNARIPLEWECHLGHRWLAASMSIRNNGSWCPHCAGKAKKNLSHCQQLASSRGGKCLSAEYKNIKTKMIWVCDKNHEWETNLTKIQQGQWCPECAIKTNADAKRSSIEEMQNIAQSRGGKCISTDYTSSGHHLEWQCSSGHQWKAKPGNIRTGTWCPICSGYRSERICRAYFETIFGEKFPKAYPSWLKLKNGNRLELDGYCEKLGIAFEHQGEQHYSCGRRFSKNKNELKELKYRDKIKRKLCKKYGIILIEIPALGVYTQFSNLETFLINEFDRKNIKIPTYGPIDLNWSDIYTSEDIEKFEKLKNIAQNRGGEMLSSVYNGQKHKYLWKCKNGHIWEAIADSILRQNTWCAICSKKAKHSIEYLQNIAESHGGKCLSNKYFGIRESYRWICKEGHKFKALGSNISTKKQWCPVCGHKKSGISRRIPIICTTNNTIYPSLTDASLKLDISVAAIANVLKGKYNSSKGLSFKYYEDPND